MPFTVCVASDVYGSKINLELDFPYAPSLSELTSTTEAAFNSEQQGRRPNSPSFQVSKFHVVDAITDDWVEVIGAHQLRHQCQVYAFQPHSTRYTESQGHIPAAQRPRPGYRGPGAPMTGSMTMGVAAGASSASYSHTINQHGSSPGGVRSDYGYSNGAGNNYGVPPPPAFPAAVAVPGAPSMPDNASHDDKVRILFELTDANNNRVVESDELKRIMHMVHIDFSQLTIEDLFRKGDHDKDGVINFPEWQRFAELYPTLMDSMYYRLKAHWDHLAGEAQVEAARHLRAQFEANERAAKEAFDRSQIEAEDGQRRLTDADRAAADAAARQRGAEDAARDGVRDVDTAKAARADRERELAAERERERQAQQRAAEAARELDAAQRRLQSAQQGLADADAAERRAAQALHDAQRERERQAGVVEQSAADAQRAQDRHNQLMSDIPRALEEAASRLQAAERELAAADQRQRDLGSAASDAAGQAAEAARMRDELMRILQGLRDRQEPSRLAWLEAQRALEEHDRAISELEAQLAAEREKRRALDDQERQLVEQEVRLREQRESLEEKEGALRDAHNNFFSTANRASPGRSASRSPALGARSPVTSTYERNTYTSSSYNANAAASSRKYY